MKNKIALYVALGLVIVSVLGLAYITATYQQSLSYEETAKLYRKGWTERSKRKAKSAERDYDFTSFIDGENTVAPQQVRRADGTIIELPDSYPAGWQPRSGNTQQAMQAGQARQAGTKENYPTASNTARGTTQKEANGQTQAGNPLSNLSLPSVPSGGGKTARSSAARGGGSYSSARAGSGGISSYTAPSRADEQLIRERDRKIFASINPKMTSKQERAMQNSIRSMSANLDRAVKRALMAGSKRENNLAKYMPQRSEDGTVLPAEPMAEGGNAAASMGGNSAEAAASYAADVNRQLSSHAKKVVQDMRKNYGDKAAEKAGDLMNNFQQDMSKVLTSNLPVSEKQLQAQGVNAKYTAELQQLNHSESMEQTAMLLRAENEEELKQIREEFNPQTEAALRPIMEKYVQQRSAILKGKYTEEEANAKLLELENQYRKDKEAALIKVNPDDQTVVRRLQDLENKRIEDALKRQKEAEEQEGEPTTPKKIYYVPKNEKVIDQWKDQWDIEARNVLKNFSSLGEEAQQEALALANEWKTKRAELIESDKSGREIEEENVKLTKETNERMQQLYVQHRTEQLNASSEQLLENVGREMGLPEEKQEEFQSRAHKIMADSNREIAELEVSADPKFKQKQRAILQHRQEALQALMQELVAE